MIVAKTPLRIPIAGGLTDLKPYAMRFGGVTVSTTIDKYIYVILRGNGGSYFDLKYHNVHERVTDVDQIGHSLIREAIKLTGLSQHPFEMVILSDLQGESGLGSSGALTVGLLHAMYAFKGEAVDKRRLLTEAAHIEVDILAGASGYHDPTICALGGLKLIEYGPDGIAARDIELTPAAQAAFERSLMFYYTARHAKSKPSLDLLISQLDEAHETLHHIKALGYQAEKALLSGDIDAVGRVLAAQQTAKMQLPGHFVDDYVTEITERVNSLGGYTQLPGGKISAFLLIICPPERQATVRAALADFPEVPLKLDTGGTRVVHI